MRSSTPQSPAPDSVAEIAPAGGLGRVLVTVVLITCMVLALLVLSGGRSDPYTRQTLELKGSVEHGALLFRLNCAGCHGIAAQGLVGPDLHGVAERRNQRQLIRQVVSGRTPPMPSFQPEPQAMADLLAYLNGLV